MQFIHPPIIIILCLLLLVINSSCETPQKNGRWNYVRNILSQMGNPKASAAATPTANANANANHHHNKDQRFRISTFGDVGHLEREPPSQQTLHQTQVMKRAKEEAEAKKEREQRKMRNVENWRRVINQVKEMNAIEKENIKRAKEEAEAKEAIREKMEREERRRKQEVKNQKRLENLRKYTKMLIETREKARQNMNVVMEQLQIEAERKKLVLSYCARNVLEEISMEFISGSGQMTKEKRRSWQMNGAIRLGLRKFFCDEFIGKGVWGVNWKGEANWEYNQIGAKDGGQTKKGDDFVPFANIGQFERTFRRKRNLNDANGNNGSEANLLAEGPRPPASPSAAATVSSSPPSSSFINSISSFFSTPSAPSSPPASPPSSSSPYSSPFSSSHRSSPFSSSPSASSLSSPKTTSSNHDRQQPELLHYFDSDFKLTIYYPKEFHKLWHIFGADPFEMMESLTGNGLKVFVNPADSKSLFLLTHDKQFFLKTVKQVGGKNVEQEFFFTNQQQKMMENFKEEQAKKGGSQFEWSESFKLSGIGKEAKKEEASKPPEKHEEQENKGRKQMLGRGETFKRSDTLKGVGTGKEAIKEEASTPPEGGGGKGRKEEEAKFEGGFAQYYEYIQRKGNNTFLPKFHMLFRFEWLPKEANTNRKSAEYLNFARFYGKTVNGFFPEGLVLEEHLAKSFHATLNDDSKFLADRDILDYSLLIGIHFEEDNIANNVEGHKEEENTNNVEGHAQEVKVEEGKQQLGYSAKCRKCQKWEFDEKGKVKWNLNNDGEEDDRRVRIYFGIIDMLQTFVVAKKLESAAKTMLSLPELLLFQSVGAFPPSSSFNQDHSLVTIIHPNEYQTRFMDYIKMVVFKSDQEKKMENMGVVPMPMLTSSVHEESAAGKADDGGTPPAVAMTEAEMEKAMEMMEYEDDGKWDYAYLVDGDNMHYGEFYEDVVEKQNQTEIMTSSTAEKKAEGNAKNGHKKGTKQEYEGESSPAAGDIGKMTKEGSFKKEEDSGIKITDEIGQKSEEEKNGHEGNEEIFEMNI